MRRKTLTFVTGMVLGIAVLAAGCGQTDTASETAEETAGAESENEVSDDTVSVSAGDAEDVEMTDGETEETAAQTESADAFLTVTPEDGFSTYGFTYFVCDTPGTYTFTASDTEEREDAVVWSVYLLDEEFSDAERYLPQAYTYALQGDGSLDIEEGEYVYIECSNHSFTADEPLTGPELIVTID